jgi:hypothetical protein
MIYDHDHDFCLRTVCTCVPALQHVLEQYRHGIARTYTLRCRQIQLVLLRLDEPFHHDRWVGIEVLIIESRVSPGIEVLSYFCDETIAIPPHSGTLN